MKAIFDAFLGLMRAQGLEHRKGKLIDATIAEAPKQGNSTEDGGIFSWLDRFGEDAVEGNRLARSSAQVANRINVDIRGTAIGKEGSW